MQEKKYIEAKQNIRSVLLTYQKGVSLNEFLISYKDLVGERLPSRSLSFTSDIELLRSMPDVVHISNNDIGKICLTGIADSTSRHIQALVSKQRKPRPNNKSNKSFRQPFKSTISYKSRPFVPGPLRAEMIQVASMYPHGVALPSFVLAYFKTFNKYLTLEKGLTSLESMISVIPDLDIKTISNEKRIFYKKFQNGISVSKSESVSKENCQTEKKSPPSQVAEGGKSQLVDKTSSSISVDRSGIPEAIQKNFLKVLENFSDGILAVHFPPLYENVIGQPFDLLELGYNSIIDLVDALPGIFKRTIDPHDGKSWIIVPSNASVKYPIGEDSTSPKIAPLVKHQEFKAPVLPANTDLNEFLPVFVSAIANPCLFWFQLQLNEEIASFESLETDIGSFYGRYSSDKYKMHDADIFIGATCIVQCPDDKQWYRAVIKAIPTSELVNVLFVDYGSRDNVPRKSLRYARSKYMDFPAHAFAAELAGVRPAGDSVNWDSRATEKFIDLCSRASLMARLIPIDGGAFSVYLCDTSGDDDIYINDTLIKEGYADLRFGNKISGSDYSNELSNSDFSSGINSDIDICAATNSGDSPFQTSDVPGDSCTDYREPKSLELGKQHSTPDSGNLAVNRKLNFSNENKSNDSEPKDCSSSNGYCLRRYIKRVKDYNYLFHIINDGKNPLVSAGDVSRLLWKDDSPSYVIQRLMDKEITIPTVVLSKNSYTELFKQCEWYKLVDMKSNDLSLNLYTLENALKILNIFGHPSLSVKRAIEGEMRDFDPHSTLWQEFSYDNWEEIESEIEKENLSNLCLLDLKAKSQALKMKRMKFLKVNSSTCIAEVKRIDHLLFVIQKRIEYINALWSED